MSCRGASSANELGTIGIERPATRHPAAARAPSEPPRKFKLRIDKKNHSQSIRNLYTQPARSTLNHSTMTMVMG